MELNALQKKTPKTFIQRKTHKTSYTRIKSNHVESNKTPTKSYKK